MRIEYLSSPVLGEAFSFELSPPSGRTMGQFSSDLQAAAALYKNNLPYGFPSVTQLLDSTGGGYNSNSYVAGVLNAVAPKSNFPSVVQMEAARRGFRVPGIENPIPLPLVR